MEMPKDCNPEFLKSMSLEVWVDYPRRLFVNSVPLMSNPAAVPVALKQYPMSQDTCLGIQSHISRLTQACILVTCQSLWNTPLLLVKKPNRKYWLVHDLCATNATTVTLHAMLPNPYTLLGLLLPDVAWFACLYLKDAFFCQ